jgi:hypothetical protein
LGWSTEQFGGIGHKSFLDKKSTNAAAALAEWRLAPRPGDAGNSALAVGPSKLRIEGIGGASISDLFAVV